MKKTILTILICGFMVLGITGCGGKKKYELSIPKEENVESILFEKNDKAGKKLLLTGSGRCNYANEIINSDCYFTENSDLIAVKVLI